MQSCGMKQQARQRQRRDSQGQPQCPWVAPAGAKLLVAEGQHPMVPRSTRSPNAHNLEPQCHALLLTFRSARSRPFASPNAHILEPLTEKPSVGEWTGTDGSSRRRRSQYGSGGSGGQPKQRSACCHQRLCSIGRTPGWR